MNFIADGMLGKLSKWLRILGYDVSYSATLNDAELARIARMEDRILLTRDTQLVKRKGLKSVLSRSDQPEEQLRQLVDELDLRVDVDSFTRCLVCNTLLVDVEAQAVASQVPAYVLATQAHFRCCPTCARVYWRGTHWQRMRDRLGALSSRRVPNA